MLRLIRYTPKLLPVVAWAMVSAMDSRYANEFVVYNCKDGPADAKAVQDPEIVDLIAKGSVEAIKHSTDSFCRECQLALLDFTEEARAVPYKFHILHGDDDRIVQLSQSQAFAAAVPGTTLEIVPGAGQLLFYSHWRSVLAAV
jgi:pimeloyl-ACP methyl ester carboxylesterase